MPTIEVTSPTETDRRIVGLEEAILWTATDVSGNIEISLSLDGTTYPVTLGDGLFGSGEFLWTPLLSQISPTAKIRVRSGATVAESELFRVATTQIPVAIPLDLSSAPPDRQIAAQMAWLVSNEPQFDGILAEQVIDPKRKVKDMVTGQVLVDMIGVGTRSTQQNRRRPSHEFVTHAAVRSKLNPEQITAEKLDQLGAIAKAVQTFFEALSSIDLGGGSRATLIKAEPFVHLSREQLFASGLFLSPIEFTWKIHRG